jgi:hypothetical protein
MEWELVSILKVSIAIISSPAEFPSFKLVVVSALVSLLFPDPHATVKNKIDAKNNFFILLDNVMVVRSV